MAVCGHMVWSQTMTTFDIIISTVELSRALTAKDMESHPHVMRTVGDAARFMRTNFPWHRKGDVAWQGAAMSLEQAAATGNAEQIAAATIALEVLLNEDGLLVE